MGAGPVFVSILSPPWVDLRNYDKSNIYHGDKSVAYKHNTSHDSKKTITLDKKMQPQWQLVILNFSRITQIYERTTSMIYEKS